MKIIFIIFALIFLSGCASTIEAWKNRQVIEDQLISEDKKQEIGTLSVTAQRRLIIGNLKTGNFCSEPPPEAADSITTAIAAALKANITADKSVSAELASNFARHVNQLYKRSHTVQLFRDASYHLCVDAVNSSNGKDVNSSGYKSYKPELTKIVDSLIPSLDKEVTLYYATEKARAERPPELSKEMILCDSNASVGDTSGSSDKLLSTSITCRPLTQVIQKKDETK